MPVIAEVPDKDLAEKIIALKKISILGLDISIQALSAKKITESEIAMLEALVSEIGEILHNTRRHFPVTML
jgi:hypothetical protein